jgi:hypothetical protein
MKMRWVGHVARIRRHEIHKNINKKIVMGKYLLGDLDVDKTAVFKGNINTQGYVSDD